MSFCNTVKTGLCAVADPEHGIDFGCGLLFSHAGRDKSYLLRTDTAEAVSALEETYEQATGTPMPIIVRRTAEFQKTFPVSIARRGSDIIAPRKKAVKESVTVGFREPQQRSKERILKVFGLWSTVEDKLELNRRLYEQGGAAAFLRGVFVANGVISDPSGDYHMEFCGLTQTQAEQLCLLLTAVDFTPAVTLRAGRYSVYFKNSEQIEYLLAFMGEMDAVFAMGNLRVERDISNRINRQINCDAANLVKSRDAAKRQIAAIGYIIEKKGTDYLSPELRLTAAARLENEDASLAELGKMLGLGRSGVNHRIEKLMRIYEQLVKKEGSA